MHFPLYAGLTALGLAVLSFSGVLWLRYGEVIYFERLVGMIASCF